VCGKTVSEVRKLRRDDLIAEVGGLPQASAHAAQLALDALAAVLNQIEAREKSARSQGNVFR
jgi:NifU-like protein involved in Fe-S cluster formation